MSEGAANAGSSYSSVMWPLTFPRLSMDSEINKGGLCCKRTKAMY
jgi:hypothetical protein